jgi:hypothetical protein
VMTEAISAGRSAAIARAIIPSRLWPIRWIFRPVLFSAFSIVSFNCLLMRRLGHSVLKPILEKNVSYPIRASH